jgi:CDP-glucose 4,6-dehydratase
MRSLEGLGLMSLDRSFWEGKRVLVTGHTGFKGGWLVQWLDHLGANVSGIGLEASTNPSLFQSAKIHQFCNSNIGDIRDVEFLRTTIIKFDPEIVLHLAAQPLVRYGYDHPLETFSTNVMGTANLLAVLRNREHLKVCVVITTDKVYENQDWAFPYRETDPLGGYDPYSASKASSELVTNCFNQSYFAKNGVAISTARAGNVIGGGDWSLDRLIPDAMTAWKEVQKIKLRQPNSIRPWQHVLEPLYGYMKLVERSWHNPALSGPYNFGPKTDEVVTVEQLLEMARRVFGVGPDLIEFGHDGDLKHETKMLALEIAKTSSVLGVKPLWNIGEAIQRTTQWYKEYLNGADPVQLCKEDIGVYETNISERDLHIKGSSHL